MGRLLGLAMIVKDEARSIAKTLESVKPFVDHIEIVDTGSTDGTQKLINRVTGKWPHKAPFVDFSTTRNLALSRCEHHTDFVLMLSGDETLQGGAELREHCQRLLTDGAGAYHLNVQFGHVRYGSPRLSRAERQWRYKGVAHEVLVGPNDEVAPLRALDGVTVLHDVSHKTPEAQKKRWETDLVLLGKETATNPHHARTAFYYAQTLHNLGHHDAAIQAYKRRVGLGGWREEVYESKFRIAQIFHKSGKTLSEVQAAYLDAYSFAPHRAEPLVEVAQLWFAIENHQMCFLFAQRACQLAYPTGDVLFVNERDYLFRRHDLLAISAFYVGAKEAGRTAAEIAHKFDPNDSRLLRNLEFYA